MPRYVVLAMMSCGLWSSESAFAQDDPLPPPIFDSHNPWRRIEFQTATIRSLLDSVEAPSAQIALDLQATNTLLEATSTSIIDATFTSAALDDTLSVQVPSELDDLAGSLDDYFDECDDAAYTCTGSTRTVTVDNITASSSCYPYTCAHAGACNTFCVDDGQCSGGTHCEGSTCIRNQPPKCVLSVVVDGAGNMSECLPYDCEDGACFTSCTGTAQCATGFVCDTAHALCVTPAPPSPPDDDIF